MEMEYLPLILDCYDQKRIYDVTSYFGSIYFKYFDIKIGEQLFCYCNFWDSYISLKSKAKE